MEPGRGPHGEGDGRKARKMKKLLVTYLLLAGGAAMAAILVTAWGGGRGAGLPVVLVWHISGTLPERMSDGLPFLRGEEASLAAIYPPLRAAPPDPRGARPARRCATAH